MKIHSLELENIGPFRKKEFLDFMTEPLCSASILAVTGRTASGKTTLMIDAICVALYNKTPRLDSNKNKNRGHLLNQSTNEGFVKLIFEINGKIYIANWVAKRNKNGNVDSKSIITEKDTKKIVNVTDIFGMDFDGFRRSVLLAQGEFSAFLYANMDEKRNIIETVADMEIYNTLKIRLNDKVGVVTTKYNGIEDILKTIPSVSQEMIIAEKKKLEKLDTELLGLNKLKCVSEKEREIEQRRHDIYCSLEDSKVQYQELISNKDEMDNIRQEIELANKAIDIRSDMDLYNSKKKQYDDLNAVLKNTNEEFEKEQNNFNSARSEYDSVHHNLENARSDAIEKRSKFDRAANCETKGNSLLEEAKNKREEAEVLKNNNDQLEIDISNKNVEIERLKNESIEDNKFIETYRLPDNINESIVSASEKAALAKRNEEVLGIEKGNLKNKKLEHKKCKKGLKTISDDDKDYEAKKNECIIKLNNNKESIEQLTVEGDKNYWISIKYTWENLKDIRDKFIGSYDTFSKLFSDKSVCTNSQNIFNETINIYKSKIELLNIEIAGAEEKLRSCNEEREFEYARYQAIVLRNKHLKDGAPCLVCGSLEHPWENKVDVDIEESIKNVDKNVQVAKFNLQVANDRLKTVLDELFEISRKRVTECEIKISRIDTLLGENNSIEYESNIIQEIINIIGRINDIEYDISKYKKEFFEIIPLECRSDTIEYSLKHFNDLIVSINKCKKRQGERDQKINELNSSINNDNRHLEEDTKKYNNLLQIIEEKYEHEGKRYLRIAMENTDGLGAKVAKDTLEKRLSEFERQEKDSNEKYQESNNKVITVEQKLQDLKADIERVSLEYDNAKSGYIQALENAGFQSIEDHIQSFREKIWLEKNNSIISKYQQDIRIVKDAIASQEKNFSEIPYNVSDIEDIRNKETSLGLLITEKIKEQGEIGERIKNFEENMNKRYVQQKLLDSAEKEKRRWESLHNIMDRNDFRDFALETMFDIIISFANDQLSNIEPRYYLKVRGMDDIVIVDNWNAGEPRTVNTLSGGESFIVSLSLALALSEISMGHSRIQSLFIDEGFGTLDSETLEKVLYALERLKLSGKTIYIISHIDQLTRRIPVRIDVKTVNGVSRTKVKSQYDYIINSNKLDI